MGLKCQFSCFDVYWIQKLKKLKPYILYIEYMEIYSNFFQIEQLSYLSDAFKLAYENVWKIYDKYGKRTIESNSLNKREISSLIWIIKGI